MQGRMSIFLVLLALANTARGQWSTNIWPATNAVWLVPEHFIEIAQAITERNQAMDSGVWAFYSPDPGTNMFWNVHRPASSSSNYYDLVGMAAAWISAAAPNWANTNAAFGTKWTATGLIAHATGSTNWNGGFGWQGLGMYGTASSGPFDRTGFFPMRLLDEIRTALDELVWHVETAEAAFKQEWPVYWRVDRAVTNAVVVDQWNAGAWPSAFATTNYYTAEEAVDGIEAWRFPADSDWWANFAPPGDGSKGLRIERINQHYQAPTNAVNFEWDMAARAAVSPGAGSTFAAWISRTNMSCHAFDGDGLYLEDEWVVVASNRVPADVVVLGPSDLSWTLPPDPATETCSTPYLGSRYAWGSGYRITGLRAVRRFNVAGGFAYTRPD